MANDQYDVGYRKPPKATQFAKGKSGNPKGRPKHSRNLLTLFDNALDDLLLVQKGRKQIHISAREVLVKRVVNAALNGDAKSIKILIDMDQARKEQEPEAIELTADDAEQYARLERRILDKAARTQPAVAKKRPPRPAKKEPAKEGD